jgi:hypothetical protein
MLSPAVVVLEDLDLITKRPSDTDKQRILALYLDRFGDSDDVTRRRLQQALARDLGRPHLVLSHIEESRNQAERPET